MSLNTVAQCDTRLLQMELDWKLNRSGPFPDGIQNAIANLRAALVIREAEASQESRAPTGSSTHNTTSVTAISETTTTPKRLNRTSDARHVMPVPARSKVKWTTTTTTTDSNPTTTMTEQRDNEASALRTEEEQEKRVEKQDRAEEREPARREVETGEQEGIEESKGEVRGKPPLPRAHPAPIATVREPRWFDWATETDKSIGPVPNARDFRSTTTVPASPDHAPSRCKPATRLPDSHATPLQPVRTPSQPIRACTSAMGAPSDPVLAASTHVSCTPAAYTPAAPVHSMHASTAPVDPVPVSTTKCCVPITAPPQIPAKRAPTAIVHAPRDLSALRSDTRNPWGSLRRRHSGRHTRVPRRFTRQRQYPPIYPVNTYLHTAPTPKPPAPTPTFIFETVRHPHGIGPNKPVIRVPAWMEIAKSTYPAPSDQAIAKSAPPSHPAAPVQCRCGQLVPISGNQVSRSFPVHHAFSSFISQFISLSFPFPRQFFSRFTFS